MSARPLAHSANDQGNVHDLEKHLHDTAQQAGNFAEAFGSKDFARIAGLWHDLGKNALDFQARLAKSADAHVEEACGKVDHSSAGAIHALDNLRTGLGRPVAFVIAGHHAGLADEPDLFNCRLPNRRDRLQAALNNPAAVVPEVLKPAPPPFLHNAAGTSGDESKRRYELWIRMLFSCLVDADFLDTEAHFDEAKAKQRRQFDSIGELKAMFDRHMVDLQTTAISGQVNDVRQRVLQSCLTKGRACPQGVFTLTAPTGCGKTLAGMGFAIEHAIKHKLERIIVVIPYTSIIDQNAKVYRDVFGAANVVEHHASIDQDDPRRENHRSRLARENWDAPIVVTTSVQFLESLLANRTSRCRKLHNIVRSVVIFDEVQTLPIPYLLPILDVLKELVRAYGVSLILSTATQPALEYRVSGPSQAFPGFEGAREIVDDVPTTFERLKRVEVKWPKDLLTPTTWAELAKEINDEDEVLVIVHKRDDARDLARMVPDSIHLSALMCPAHRLKTIEQIKARLKENRELEAKKEPVRPIRVVSTQLVEAGVDLDFPAVYRAMAGFDSIAQAAGRCNREGLLGRKGIVRIFIAPTDPPTGTLRDGFTIARTMLSADMELDALDPKLFDSYFRRLYFGRSLDEKGIQALRQALKFRNVAEEFKVIEDDGSEAVVVPYGPDFAGLLADLDRHGPNRDRLRALQMFVVTLYPHQLQLLKDAEAVETIADLVWAIKCPTYQHLYNARFGLLLDGPVNPNPAVLVVSNGGIL